MKKALLTAVAIFLTAFVTFPQFLEASNLLNPPTKINDLPFEYKCEAWGLALTLYKLEGMKSDERIGLERKLASALTASKIRFDLLNAGRKGCTRYYPFSIKGKFFLARIFLTKEAGFQEPMDVLFEAASQELGVTFQILPGVSSLLETCRARPLTISVSSETDRSV